MPGLDMQELEDARGLEHGGDTRAVVVRALRGIPVVKVRAEKHHFAGIGTLNIGDHVALFARTWEGILDIEAYFYIAMDKQAAKKSGVFAGDGENRERSSGVKAKRRGVHH